MQWHVRSCPERPEPDPDDTDDDYEMRHDGPQRVARQRRWHLMCMLLLANVAGRSGCSVVKENDTQYHP